MKEKLDKGVEKIKLSVHVHDKKRSGRPIIQTDEIVEQVNRKLRNDRLQKNFARWVPEIDTDKH